MNKLVPTAVFGTMIVLGGAASAAPTTAEPARDCRTYSSVKLCGTPHPTTEQRHCITHHVNAGMTPRRATTECTTSP
ncbi:hypothetical protein [Spirillospora sp. CA-294931]|uniref:hypothetical protein n=1 Tax=Spirillospora sp. CA-294931 TaxID=3240042 RepID=UPI003D92A722